MNRPEQALQKAMAEWLDYALPNDVYWTAVNPVPAKSKAVAGLSKAMGLKPGAPDLVFCIKGRFVGVEVKAGKGTPSKVQDKAHEAITLSGGMVHTVRSIDELAGFLEGLGVGLRAR